MSHGPQDARLQRTRARALAAAYLLGAVLFIPNTVWFASNGQTVSVVLAIGAILTFTVCAAIVYRRGGGTRGRPSSSTPNAHDASSQP